jgi:bla regulator protein BlaR1
MQTAPVNVAIDVLPIATPAPVSLSAQFWNWGEACLAVYLIGAFVLLLRLAIGTIRANRLTCASCASPVTVGFLRPRILLPESSSEWPQGQLDAVLTHEQAHACRRDPLFQWLALFNRAVFWFHPLAWWLERKLSALAEEACDAAVLERGHDPREYSRHLLELARAVQQAGTRVNAPAMAMPGSYLPQRVKKIIEGVRPPIISRTRLAFAALVCAIPAAVFAAGTLDHAAQILPLPSLPASPLPLPPALIAQAAQPAKAPAQTTQPAPASAVRQEFEVAMLRLEDPHSTVDYNRPDAPNQSNTFPTNRFTMFHTGLKSLIAAAYGVPYNTILGGPAWLDSQHYDISAKVDGDTRVTKKQMQPMLQNLLKERLHLAVHSEHRIVPGYAMVIAKGGSKLKPNTGAPFAGMDAGFELKFQNASPDLIAQLVEGTVKQPVVDKTGLGGTYDFHLMFTREDHLSDVPHPDYGSIFSAIEEQLGLKLVAQRIPVDYLVIDHLEKVPTEN